MGIGCAEYCAEICIASFDIAERDIFSLWLESCMACEDAVVEGIYDFGANPLGIYAEWCGKSLGHITFGQL